MRHKTHKVRDVPATSSDIVLPTHGSLQPFRLICPLMAVLLTAAFLLSSCGGSMNQDEGFHADCQLNSSVCNSTSTEGAGSSGLSLGAIPPPPPPEPQPARFPASVPVFEIVSPVSLPVWGEGTNTEPPYLIPIEIFNFGTRLTRITDNEVFGLSNGRAVHLYSKHQAWNADESLIDTGNHIIDATSFALVSRIPLSTARNWSNVQPDLMIGIHYNPESASLNRLVAYDTLLDQIHRLEDFSDYRDCSFGNQEGNLSADDRYLVLACTQWSSDEIILLSFDLRERVVLGRLTAAENYNWVSVSPSGQFILVENNRFPDADPTLWRYDIYFDNPTNLGRPAHGDFGRDENGEEVYVMVNGQRFFYVRLNDGARFDIKLDERNYPAGHGHVSCRNVFRPGWCYFSSRDTSRVGAFKVSPKESQMEPWGYHYSTSSSYAASPRLTVNRSGTQLLFSSDWQGIGKISDYLLEVRFP